MQEVVAQVKKVYLMMSGGVDSSVAAYLLKQNPNYEVFGVFMKCWSLETLRKEGFSDDLYACSWEDDARDAKMVAYKLGIPFEIWDFQQEYASGVVGYMLSEYEAGRTPNPDVMCNSIVKFGAFYDKAVAKGADYVATGHYAKIRKGEDGASYIALADDTFKDQSYFLWKIAPERLAKTLLPIGEISSKKEVREIAERESLVTASKKDSQGLCFVGKTSLRGMLLEKFGTHPGSIVTLVPKGGDQGLDLQYVSKAKQITNKVKKEAIEKGYVTMSQHESACLYTIGQRDGLGIGAGPWYVSKIDIKNNLVYVIHHDQINSLDSKKCIISGLNIFDKNLDFTDFTKTYKAQIRYNQELVLCKLKTLGDGQIEVEFNEPVRSVTLGQSCVVFNEDGLLVMGGVIVG